MARRVLLLFAHVFEQAKSFTVALQLVGLFVPSGPAKHRQAAVS